jgi:hypothetical protein
MIQPTNTEAPCPILFALFAKWVGPHERAKLLEPAAMAAEPLPNLWPQNQCKKELRLGANEGILVASRKAKRKFRLNTVRFPGALSMRKVTAG